MKGLESKDEFAWCNKSYHCENKLSRCVLKRYDGTTAHVQKATEKS